MDLIFPLFAFAVALSTGLVLIAVRAANPLWLRTAALGLTGVLMLTGYAGFVELLGRPKPASKEWVRETVKEATVLASNMREGEAIFLWLKLDGADEPRAYALPWSMKTAKQLRQAQQQAMQSKTRVRMRKPFSRERQKTEPAFYAESHRPLPPKETVTTATRPYS